TLSKTAVGHLIDADATESKMVVELCETVEAASLKNRRELILSPLVCLPFAVKRQPSRQGGEVCCCPPTRPGPPTPHSAARHHPRQGQEMQEPRIVREEKWHW